MYLSRVEIDRNNRRKTRDLTHLGAYHNWVEQSFPEEYEDGVRTRKLWRIDPLNGKDYLLIVSPNQPNVKNLVEYGVSGTVESKEYDTYLKSLEEGMLCTFRITLNPVQSISTGKKSGKRGRIVPHVTVEQQLDFLQKQAEKNGFKLIENQYGVVERSYQPLKKHENKRPIKISQVTYEGQLEIVNIELLLQALVQGIGKKKAYGCGLLTIIPMEKLQ